MYPSNRRAMTRLRLLPWLSFLELSAFAPKSSFTYRAPEPRCPCAADKMKTAAQQKISTFIVDLAAISDEALVGECACESPSIQGYIIANPRKMEQPDCSIRTGRQPLFLAYIFNLLIRRRLFDQPESAWPSKR